MCNPALDASTKVTTAKISAAYIANTTIKAANLNDFFILKYLNGYIILLTQLLWIGQKPLKPH
jgi:hypothetical protein